MVTSREDFKKAIAEGYEWYWDGVQEDYKQHETKYDKIADVKSFEDIKGDHASMTSGVGMDEIPEKDENEAIELFNPTEGFTVLIKKRRHSVIVPASQELDEDFNRAASFLKDYAKNDLPRAVRMTKDRIVAKLLDRGFETGGDAIYNNTCPTATDASGDLVYDGKPLLAKSGNEREAKNGDEYYNALDAEVLSYDSLVTADNLLTITNAKMENGQEIDLDHNKKLVVKKNKIKAKTILNSALVPGSQNNDSNELQGEYDVIYMPYLSNDYYWFGIIGGFGMAFYDSDPTIKFFQDQNTGEFRVRIYLPLAYGIYNWRGFVGSDATS